MNNESILHELQKDLISKETDIVSILRKAHIIASKLSFDEFDKLTMWISPMMKTLKQQEKLMML